MKKAIRLLTFLSFVISVTGSFAQKKESKYVSTFDETFKDENDKKNIQKLRDYLYTRDEDLKKLKVEQAKYSKADSILQSYQNKYIRLNNIISENGGTTLQVPQNLLNEITDSKEVVVKNRTEVMRAISYDSVAIETSKGQVAAFNDIAKGIENAEQDINRCRSTLDSLLAIELLEQTHKQKVSLYFIILIGALLAFFFLAFLSDRPIVMILMGDYGLQFITIFVLIIAVVLFGVLGILQSSELAAILSGISGYILGKGRDGTAQPKIPPGGNASGGRNPTGGTGGGNAGGVNGGV